MISGLCIGAGAAMLAHALHRLFVGTEVTRLVRDLTQPEETKKPGLKSDGDAFAACVYMTMICSALTVGIVFAGDPVWAILPLICAVPSMAIILHTLGIFGVADAVKEETAALRVRGKVALRPTHRPPYAGINVRLALDAAKAERAQQIAEIEDLKKKNAALGKALAAHVEKKRADPVEFSTATTTATTPPFWIYKDPLH